MNLIKRLASLEKLAPKTTGCDVTTGIETMDGDITVITYKAATASTSTENKQHWHTIKLDNDGFPFYQESDDITLIYKSPTV